MGYFDSYTSMKRNLFADSKDELARLFETPKKIALVVHCNPDGDAIGSALALKHYFVKAGHLAKVIAPNAYAQSYAWMPQVEQTLVYEQQPGAAKALLDESDILFGVDFNDWERTNKLASELISFQGVKIVIDHHPNPSENLNTPYVFSCIEVSSAAEIVYEFMLEMNLAPIDEVIASCIFTGIMTDTGNFSYNDASPRTYGIISELSAYHIDKERIRRLLFQVYSFERMRLKGFALNHKMKFFPEHNTAYIWLTKEELAQYNHQLGDTEGFVNMPLDIKEVYFSVLFIENDQKIKMSLRSKGNFDVNLFARKHFDGGGHLNAAGGRSYIGMEKTLNKFEHLLNDYHSDIVSSYCYEAIKE